MRPACTVAQGFKQLSFVMDDSTSLETLGEGIVITLRLPPEVKEGLHHYRKLDLPNPQSDQQVQAV